MPLTRLGQHRQVVIPKDVCKELGLQEGDLVEVISTKGSVVIRPKQDIDRDDRLTPQEAAQVRRGEHQLAQGESITLDEFESALERTARKRSRKTA